MPQTNGKTSFLLAFSLTGLLFGLDELLDQQSLTSLRH
jgi:hypothetical protein